MQDPSPERPKQERKLPGDVVAVPLGKLVRKSFKHGKLVITIVVILTIFMGIGIKDLKFSTDVTTFLPTEDPATEAMRELLQNIKGLESFEVIILKLDPEKAAAHGVKNITDTGSIRAQDELWRYIKAKVPQVNEMNGLLCHAYSYLNYANHAMVDPSYYRLPDSDAELALLGQVVWAVVGQLTAEMTPYLTGEGGEFDWFILPVGYEPAEKEPGEVLSLKNVDVGHQIRLAVEDYQEDCRAGNIEYDIFDFEYMTPLGVGTSFYRVTETSIWSATYLIPPIIIFILVCLFIAFRDPHTVFIALISLLVVFVWTLGLFGWLRWELSPFSLAIIPIVLGNGIDFSIHVLTDYFECKTLGFNDEESFEATGRKAGAAMLLATIDTNVGLMAMVLCGMIALAQLGLGAAFAMLSVLLLSWIFIPAMVSLSPRSREAAMHFKPSRVMPAIARKVSKHRKVVIGVFVVTSCILFVNLGNLEYMSDPITGLYPEDDYMMKEYNYVMSRIAPKLGREEDTITLEVGILEGDLTDPKAREYVFRLEDELRKNPRSISSLTIGMLNPYWYIGLYEAEAYGNIGTVLGVAQSIIPGYPIEGLSPDTREELELTLEKIRADPFWAPWLQMFVSDDNQYGILPMFYLAGTGWDESRAMKREMFAAIDRADEKWFEEYGEEPPLEIYIEGLRTSTYNFLAITSAWSWILFMLAVASSLILVFLFVRKRRAVLAIGLPMIFSSIWWLGLLPFFGIKINPGLIIPIIFITSIAPDYADHLIWNSYKNGSVDYTFSTTGKAILFSAVTDFGAFFIFSFAYIKAFVAEPMLATSICIVVMYILTVLLVPAILREKDVEIKQEEVKR